MLRSLGIAALVTLAIATPAQAGTREYVAGAQNSDGGFGMTQSGGSSQLATGWALLGLNAAGRRPGPAALGYVRRGLPSLRDIGDVERTVLVVRAAGQNPRRFGGRNLIADIMRHRDRDGSFDGFVSYTSFAIFALRRSGVSRNSGTIRSAARWLERHQNSDGGFNVGGRGASGIDDTGYAAQALGARRPARLGAPPRRDVPGPRPGVERRLPAQPRRCGQRAVDRLRGPGPGGRRWPRRRGAPRPGVPALADRVRTGSSATHARAGRRRCGSALRRCWRFTVGPSSAVGVHR